MRNLVTLLLKLPRNTEVTPEAAQTFLSALVGINKSSFWQKLTGKVAPPLSLELVSVNQQILFTITCDESLVNFVQTQIQSSYPLVIIEKIEDPLKDKELEVVRLTLKNGSYYPIATYKDFTDIDPMSNILSVLSKTESQEVSVVQISLESVGSSWQAQGLSYAEKGIKNEDGSYSPRSDQNIIKEKVSYPGFNTTVRLISNTNKTLSELASAFGVYANSEGNSFSKKSSGLLGKKNMVKNALTRKVIGHDILNVLELASLWHLPSEKIKTATIAWGTSVLSEPPESLPIASDNEEEKKTINFFAKTVFKNRETIFGLKDSDRRRHMWVIGKTGTGKSTLIANMAIDDLKKDRGMAIVDPHGDLSETLLNYIPSHRINDVVYFNPADRDWPIAINPLEVTNKEEAELVVSGIVSIFNKIFGYSWGPRLEYILRNSLMSLAEVPDATFKDIPLLLTNKSFRNKVINHLKDDTLRAFWVDEFEKMPSNLQQEAISPILNKVGQFVTSPMIRGIIGHAKSTIQIDEIMNEGKILIANLSQGKLGEDNAALLGAMLITKIQLSAMRRVDTHEESRRDFFLYVDEFQNFATNSFIKILSEARKYRLNLMLANQYMAQIPEEVQKAILGNTGTMVSFSIGASDAGILHKEFAEVFSENDLVNLNNFQIATKLTINGQSHRPFLAYTLPLPTSSNQNKEKVINVSRERWSKKK